MNDDYNCKDKNKKVKKNKEDADKAKNLHTDMHIRKGIKLKPSELSTYFNTMKKKQNVKSW